MTQGNTFHGNVNFGHAQGTTITGTATNNTYYGSDPQASQLLRLITELEQKIAEHQSELANMDELRASIEMLREQVEGNNPKPSRLRALLASMAAMAGNVTAISTAVNALHDVIR